MSEHTERTPPQFNVDGICHRCARRKGVWSCEAFDRIPVEILTGQVIHTKPYAGDRGLQFVKKV